MLSLRSVVEMINLVLSVCEGPHIHNLKHISTKSPLMDNSFREREQIEIGMKITLTLSYLLLKSWHLLIAQSMGSVASSTILCVQMGGKLLRWNKCNTGISQGFAVSTKCGLDPRYLRLFITRIRKRLCQKIVTKLSRYLSLWYRQGWHIGWADISTLFWNISYQHR